MSTQKDPLRDLLLDAAEVDRTQLASALHDLLGVDEKTGKVVFRAAFNELNAKQKLVAYLLGRKASELLSTTAAPSAPFTEIQGDIGLPKGTVAPGLRDLVRERIVSQSKSGEYYIGPHQINQAILKLKKEQTR